MNLQSIFNASTDWIGAKPQTGAMTFLFAESLDDTGCMCLRLEEDASESEPLSYRTYDVIQALQQDSYTIVVLSATQCGLHHVELPWLGDSKAREAIPYALEEQLAQKLSTLHFAFDSEHHQNKCYLVVVTDKSYLKNLMTHFDEVGILFNEITLDWFALNPGEICLTPSYALVYVEHYQGALSFDLASTYINQITDLAPVLSFTDSPPDFSLPTFTTIDSVFYLWSAKRLQQASRMNLCQGELKREHHQDSMTRKWLMACGLSIGLWFLIVLFVNGVNVIRLNHQLSLVDKDIAVIYRQFFPGAQQVINPRFRIDRLLKTGNSTQSAAFLWKLLDTLDETVNASKLTVERMDYKNKVLSVTLNAPDFNALQHLEQQLKKAHVKVAQTQASSHDKYVTAVLELRL